MSFLAKWKGDCEYCDVLIEIGDECRMLDFTNKLIAHVKCPVDPTPAVEVICDKCFLIHAGECL